MDLLQDVLCGLHDLPGRESKTPPRAGHFDVRQGEPGDRTERYPCSDEHIKLLNVPSVCLPHLEKPRESRNTPPRPRLNPVLERLPGFQVAPGFARSCQIPDLFWIGKVKLTGQRRLGVSFEKTDGATIRDTAGTSCIRAARAVVAGHACPFRRMKGEYFHTNIHTNIGWGGIENSETQISEMRVFFHPSKLARRGPPVLEESRVGCGRSVSTGSENAVGARRSAQQQCLLV